MQWNVGYIVSKRASLMPDKVALVYEDMPVTYSQLNESVNRTARYLQEKGLKKGDRIAVLLLNCPELLEVYFASAKLGLIFVPLNFRLVGPELEYQLNHSGSQMLFFHDSLLKNVEPVRERVKVDADKFLYIKSGVPDCPECPKWALDCHNVMNNCSVAEPVPDDPVEFNNPLCIMYTSGTTGAPKGAVLSHEQTYFKNFQIILRTDMRADDRFLAQSPLFHSAGLFVVATPSLCRGATIIIRQTFQPDQFAMDIEKHKVTIIFVMTAMWRMILPTGKLDEIDTNSVRVVLGGGEKTPLSLLDDLAKR